ncbi:MAG: hypothetical protein HQL88_04655, partial [Magnetococcales bacterium]|nr:hypothetical protein [Magnetococcales bacterium]
MPEPGELKLEHFFDLMNAVHGSNYTFSLLDPWNELLEVEGQDPEIKALGVSQLAVQMVANGGAAPPVTLLVNGSGFSYPATVSVATLLNDTNLTALSRMTGTVQSVELYRGGSFASGTVSGGTLLGRISLTASQLQISSGNYQMTLGGTLPTSLNNLFTLLDILPAGTSYTGGGLGVTSLTLARQSATNASTWNNLLGVTLAANRINLTLYDTGNSAPQNTTVELTLNRFANSFTADQIRQMLAGTWGPADPIVTKVKAMRGGQTLYEESARDSSGLPMDRVMERVADAANAFAAFTLGSTQLGGLTMTQMAALSSDQIAWLTPTQMRSLGSMQMAGLTPEQMGALSGTQIAGLTPAQIGALSSLQVPMLNPTQLRGLSKTQLGTLTPEQFGGLSSTQIAVLSNAQLDGLTTRQMAGLSGAQLAGMSSTQLASLTTTQAGALNSTQMAALTPTQQAGITAITTAPPTPPVASNGLSGFKEFLTGLRAWEAVEEQIPDAPLDSSSSHIILQTSGGDFALLRGNFSFTASSASGNVSQMNLYKGGQLSNHAVSGGTLLGSLSYASNREQMTIGGFRVTAAGTFATSLASIQQGSSSDRVTALKVERQQGTNWNTLMDVELGSNKVVARLRDPQGTAQETKVEMTLGGSGSFDGDSIEILLASLWGAFDPAYSIGEVLAMPNQPNRPITKVEVERGGQTLFRAESAAGIPFADVMAAYFDMAHFLAMPPSAIDPGTLTATQVGVLTPTQMKALDSAAIDTLTPEQMGRLGSAQLAALTPTQMRYLDSDQMAAMNQTQMRGLSSSQMQVLTPEQMGGLTPGQLAALSPTQVRALSSTQMAGLTPTQAQGLIGTQAAGLTPTLMQGLGSAVLQVLSSTQMRALNSSVLAGLSPTQMGALGSGQIASLSTSQLKGLSSTQLGALDATQIGGLDRTLMAALTPTQMRGLPPEAMGALGSSQIAGLDSKQLGALSTSQVRGLASGQIATMNSSQLRGLSST